MLEVLDLIAAVAVFRSRFTVPAPFLQETRSEKILWAFLIMFSILPYSILFYEYCIKACEMNTANGNGSEFVGKSAHWFCFLGNHYKSKQAVSYDQVFKLQFLSYFIPITVSTWRKSSYNKVVSFVETIPMSLVVLLIALFLTSVNKSFEKPTIFQPCLEYLLPIRELSNSLRVINSLIVESNISNGDFELSSVTELSRILFITFNLQVSTGFIGIRYIKACQKRKNHLIKLNDSKESEDCDKNSDFLARARSSYFRRTAMSFILFAAIPYLIERTAFDTLNYFAFSQTKNKFHNLVRLETIFEHDSQMFLVTQDLNSTLSPGG